MTISKCVEPIILAPSNYPFRRRAIRTLSSMRRCVPLVRRGARTQRPGFQVQPLMSVRFRRPLVQAIRAPSTDTYPPRPFPLLCHLTFHPCVGNAVPDKAFREQRSLWVINGLSQRKSARPPYRITRDGLQRSVHSRCARTCPARRLWIATGLQCISIALPSVVAIRFKLTSIGKQITRQICMAGTDRGFDQYLRQDVTLGVTCAQSLPLFAQWPEDFDRTIEMLFRICADRLANRYGQAAGDGTR